MTSLAAAWAGGGVNHGVLLQEGNSEPEGPFDSITAEASETTAADRRPYLPDRVPAADTAGHLAQRRAVRGAHGV